MNAGRGTECGGGGESCLDFRSCFEVSSGPPPSESDNVSASLSDSLSLSSKSSLSLVSAFVGGGIFAGAGFLVEGPASFSESESLDCELEDDEDDSEALRLLRFLFRLRCVERLGAVVEVIVDVETRLGAKLIFSEKSAPYASVAEARSTSTYATTTDARW